MGRAVAVCISKEKGVQKKEVGRCRLIESYGLEGDAHTLVPGIVRSACFRKKVD